MPCPRCSSENVFRAAKVYALSPASNALLQVETQADPDAVFFKDEQLAEVQADVCADCGHVELSIAEAKARALHEAWRKGAERRGR
jgi:hypothetical protein